MQHSIEAAVCCEANTVIVVLGAHAELIAKNIEKTRAQIIETKEWKEGMAASIRKGLDTLLSISPDTDAVIFMVCDQPYVSGALLNEIINIHKKTGKPIIASDYGETTGPPVLFHRSLFGELAQLKGDTGARKIIIQHSGKAATVPFANGKTDIDTTEDYLALKN